MEAARTIIDSFLGCDQYQNVLSLVKGFRNGATYGCKVRFPHSLVMSTLFHDTPIRERIQFIARATFLHARGLAFLNLTYKSICLLLERLTSEAKRRPEHVLLAGGIAGYIVFGKYNKINEQVNLYLLSRVIYGVSKLLVKKGLLPDPDKHSFHPFPWFAAFVWASVLLLFEYERDTLQSSLQSSMTYIFDDSKTWTNLTDFFFYNKYNPSQNIIQR